MSTTTWKATLILSIMLPVSLLATFKMSGVLHEPQTPETITLETVTWNMTRPTENLLVDNKVINSYDAGNVSLNMTVGVAKYYENDPDFPAYRNDYVKIGTDISIDLDTGVVYSVDVIFSDIDAHASIVLEETPPSTKLQNLTMENVANQFASWQFSALAANQSRTASLSATAYWVFLDQNNADHWMTVIFEVIYFDGITYRKVAAPFALGVLCR